MLLSGVQALPANRREISEKTLKPAGVLGAAGAAALGSLPSIRGVTTTLRAAVQAFSEASK